MQVHEVMTSGVSMHALFAALRSLCAASGFAASQYAAGKQS
jgi:hypothetical protein